MELQYELQNLDNQQSRIDGTIFQSLQSVMDTLDEQQRVRLICEKKEPFRLGGIYYQYARRMGYTTKDHFRLPLLGNMVRKFFSLLLFLLGKIAFSSFLELQRLRE